MAGGAELVVAYLAEGLAARGHRATVVSTCGPEMEPYPAEIRNGVEVLRFFPRNMYWSFAREGQRQNQPRAMARARCLESRCSAPLPRNPGERAAGHRPHARHRWLLRLDLAARAAARRAGDAHRARLSPDLSAGFSADARLEDLRAPGAAMPRLSRLAPAYRAGCRSVRQPVPIPAGQASRGGTGRCRDRRWYATASRNRHRVHHVLPTPMRARDFCCYAG